MTGAGEEGEGEAEPKELELTVLGCSRQSGFVLTSSCALQLWQTTVALLRVSEACVQTLNILQLEHFFNEALKCCNFLLGCHGLTIQAAKHHIATCLLPAPRGIGERTGGGRGKFGVEVEFNRTEKEGTKIIIMMMVIKESVYETNDPQRSCSPQSSSLAAVPSHLSP